MEESKSSKGWLGVCESELMGRRASRKALSRNVIKKCEREYRKHNNGFPSGLVGSNHSKRET